MEGLQEKKLAEYNIRDMCRKIKSIREAIADVAVDVTQSHAYSNMLMAEAIKLGALGIPREIRDITEDLAEIQAQLLGANALASQLYGTMLEFGGKHMNSLEEVINHPNPKD